MTKTGVTAAAAESVLRSVSAVAQTVPPVTGPAAAPATNMRGRAGSGRDRARQRSRRPSAAA